MRRRLRVGVDGSGLLEIEMDDLDEPEARWGGGSCGQLLLLLLLLSGLLGFATSVHLPASPHISPYLPISPATRLRHLSIYLPISPHISPYLPISPHISCYSASPPRC